MSSKGEGCWLSMTIIFLSIRRMVIGCHQNRKVAGFPWPSFSYLLVGWQKNFQALFLGASLLVGTTKSVFSLKKVSQKIFLLKNMLKIATFSLLAKKFSGKISRGDLTSRKCFSALLKKNHGCGQALISCMNYKFAKKFFVFYENFQFPRSRPLWEEKFDFFWKNQKTMFLQKKIFFFFDEIFKGYQEVPLVKESKFSTHPLAGKW